MAKRIIKTVLKLVIFVGSIVDAYIAGQAWDNAIEYCMDADDDTKLMTKVCVCTTVGGIIGLLARGFCKRIDRM